MINQSCEINLSRQCELLGINRTRIYYKPVFGEKYRYKQEIIRLIDMIHTKHPYYRSRRITNILRRIGHEVNRKRIQNYLREMGITVYYPGLNLSKRNRKHAGDS